MPVHELKIPVSFGDCDPAGIVYYPNFYRWFDRTFHNWLRTMGGHAALCERLGLVGIGLMETNARFRRPVRDGDDLRLTMEIERWGNKTLHLGYSGWVNDIEVLEGTEVRGLFKPVETGIVAEKMSAFRDLVEAYGT